MAITRWGTAALLTMLAGLGCADTLTRQERAVAREIVAGRFEIWTRAVNNRSLDSIDGMYLNDPDIEVISALGNRAIGFEEVQRQTRDFYRAIDYLNFVPVDPIVEVIAPDAATLIFRHSTTTDYRNSARVVAAGSGLMVWAKDPSDGLWKIRTELISQHASAPQ